MLVTKNFTERVRDVVRGIKKGHVLTYGEVAELSGARGAARAVGTIMKNNFDTTVPCHRVIRYDKTIGEYNRGGGKKKTSLLKHESVTFTKTGKVETNK